MHDVPRLHDGRVRRRALHDRSTARHGRLGHRGRGLVPCARRGTHPADTDRALALERRLYGERSRSERLRHLSAAPTALPLGPGDGRDPLRDPAEPRVRRRALPLLCIRRARGRRVRPRDDLSAHGGPPRLHRCSRRFALLRARAGVRHGRVLRVVDRPVRGRRADAGRLRRRWLLGHPRGCA